MRWSPISKDASLRTQLNQALRTGYAFHVVSQQGSTLGISAALSKRSLGYTHSVALVLSEHFSTSGAELFVFENDGQFALVGLADTNPTPGFDAHGSRQEIEALAEEFIAMNSGQFIRVVGNVDWLPDMVDLQPTQLAERVNKRSRLRIIQSTNLKIALAVLTLLVLGGLGLAYYKMQASWKLEQELLNIQKDTNAQYEAAIGAALAGAGPGGSSSLTSWREALKTVPTEVAGWELISLQCKAGKCLANWGRISGNFADFDSNFPYANEQRPKLIPGEKTAQSLETEHPVKAPAAGAHGLQRAKLPPLREAYLQWGSFILDAQLIPQQAASVRPATLFASGGPIGDIRKPVLKGSWQLESGLWTLKDLELPHYVVAESLTISRSSLNAGPGERLSASAFDSLVGKGLGYRYKIEGSFYAQAR
jgi:hypothetical protein